MYGSKNYYEQNPIGNGSVTRIYKNAAGDTIRIDDVSIQFFAHQRPQLSSSHDNEFHVFFKRGVKTTRFNPGPGSSRVVSEITFIGDHSSVTEAAGDFTYATWEFDDNDCEVDFTDLPGVGDSVD